MPYASDTPLTAPGRLLLASVRDAGGVLVVPKSTPGGVVRNTASITTLKGLASRGLVVWDRLAHGRLQIKITDAGVAALVEAYRRTA